MAGTEREFINPYCSYKRGETTVPYETYNSKINDKWKEELLTHIATNLKRLDQELQRSTDWKDYTVYTGVSGVAYLYMHMANMNIKFGTEDVLRKALGYVEPTLNSLAGKRIGFLCGDAGPLAIAAVLYHKLNMKSKCNDALDRLQAMHRDALSYHSDIPNEILYGRAGFLFALLFVRKHIAEDCIDTAVIRMLLDNLIKNGMRLAKKENFKCPLMYKWHGKHYLGAAHGLSGILYMILQMSEFLTSGDKTNLIKPTVDYLLTLRLPSGNYPSNIGNKQDMLIHWCHGAPGFVHLFVMAYKVFGDEKYLSEALSCGEIIWKKGLLRKGYGICHGASGNAFSFLILFRVTRDPIHLYRAVKFAEWCFSMDARRCRVPDRPLSLFEGLAGIIYFWASLLDIESAEFPAFQLW